MFKISPEVQKIAPDIIRIRQHLHQKPELSFEERSTREFLVEELKKLGLIPSSPIAKTGITALIEGGFPGPTVMLRADMDALPILEENRDLPFRSQRDGVMHACGHDGHMAMALGAARILQESRGSLKGRIKMVFQPAEEKYGGALPMIEEGVLENPKVDAAFGLHIWNAMPKGILGIRGGPFMAATDEFRVKFTSRGGHGAYPHNAVDPIVTLAHAVTAIQTLVSRNVNPIDSAVVTIGTIKSGEAVNVIPTEAFLGGTIRTLRSDVRATLLKRLEEVVNGVAASMGAGCEFTHIPGYPAVVNSPEAADFAMKVGKPIFGEGVQYCPPSLGGEDMSYFLQKVPGCFIFVGSKNDEKGWNAPHHSAHFNFDEEVLPAGTQLLVDLARGYLETRPHFNLPNL